MPHMCNWCTEYFRPQILDERFKGFPKNTAFAVVLLPTPSVSLHSCPFSLFTPVSVARSKHRDKKSTYIVKCTYVDGDVANHSTTWCSIYDF